MRMDAYFYEGFDEEGHKESGMIQALTQKEALQKLQQSGMYVVHISLRENEKGLWRQKKIWTYKKIAAFSFTMHMLLEAGVSLGRILEMMENKKGAQVIIHRLRRYVAQGDTLSEALARTGFPRLGCALIQAGEASGQIAQAFMEVKMQYEQLEKEKQERIQLLLYPSFVAGLLTVFMMFTLLYIVPVFAEVFGSMGIQIPPMMQWILKMGEFLSKDGYYVLIAILMGIYAFRMLWKHSSMSYRLDSFLWRQFGKRKIYGYARYAKVFRILHRLLEAGIPLLSSLVQVVPFWSNQYLEKEMHHVCQKIQEGYGIRETFIAYGIGTEVIYELLLAAEVSGELSRAFREASSYYEREAAEYRKRIKVLAEPILISLMGLAVAGVIMLVMEPMFQAMNIVGDM